MKKVKQILSVLLAVVMMVCAVPVMEAGAASFTPRLTAPERTGYYGTQNSYNPFRTNSSAGNGNCTWYAWGRAYELLGSRPQLSTGNANTWYPRNQSNGTYSYGSTPKLGAIACWTTGDAGHVAVVEAINDDGTFTISESSWNATSWWFRTNTIRTSYYSSFQGFIYIGDFSSAPTSAWVQLPQPSESSYLVNTQVDITFGAQNATRYHLDIYKTNDNWNGADYYWGGWFESSTGSSVCNATFSQTGHYCCYVTAYNTSGEATTSSWIGWYIVDAPSSAWVQLPDGMESSYVVNTQVDISFGSQNATRYHLVIYKTNDSGNEADYYWDGWFESATGSSVCNATFSKTGHYCCCVTAYNEYGETTSSWVGWNIVDKPPENLSISTDKAVYISGETIRFTLNAFYGYYKHIGIHKINGSSTESYCDQDVNGESYSIIISEPGDYRANFDAFNVLGTTRSDWVYFSVYDSAPADPIIDVQKDNYCIDEDISVSFVLPWDSMECYFSVRNQNDNSAIVGPGKRLDNNETTYLFNVGTEGNYVIECQAVNVCGSSAVVKKAISVLDHNYGAWTKPNDTQHWRVCSRNSSHIEKANHSWNAGIVTTEATCTATGVKTYTCSVCKGTRTEIINKVPHQTTLVNAKDATYTADGYTGDTYCTVCKQTLAYGSVIPKLTKPEEPTNPTDSTQPTAQQQQQSGSCRYCGGTHTGFPGVLIGFIHSILAMFGLRKK